ncbi:MAG TPA: hypothetical protein VGC97_00445 [Pyrinomonadaceae bacterium]|jgi:hypothetical protein
MQTLGLNGTANSSQTNLAKTPKVGFWKRQFQSPANSKQKTYDWIFGVILPVICFVFDPIVFKGRFVGSALFADYRPFAYVLCSACITALAAWLIFDEKLRWLNGFLAGLFFLGGVISLGVGIVLFPFSFVGLMILIGALGFTPLFTAVIYLRNAFRALDASKMFLVKSVRNYAFAFGIIFSASLAWTINSEVKNSLRNIEYGDAEAVYAEQTKLKFLAPLVNFDNLISIYHREPDGSDKSKAVAEVYKAATGESIENKSYPFRD